MRLKDKVIVLTGGTGILGSAFASSIVEQGGRLILVGRDPQKLAQKVAELGSLASCIVADVMNEAELKTAAQQIKEQFGSIDGLVNAAGGNVPEAVVAPEADVFDLNMEGMKKAFDLNLFGTLLPIQVFGKLMNKGSIVNISSVSSKRALTKVLGYSMGKAALDIYTKWFAVETANRFGDKIRINAITPGFFLTDQNRNLLLDSEQNLTPRAKAIINNTPFKRFGEAQELTGTLIFLLSDESKFVTGTEIVVDGGFSQFSGV
jgi:NAD(P)-dependent dehydrogenase (short-subunit alcohol dehydrogenase family)